MVRLRKRDDKLVWPLIHRQDVDAFLLEPSRVHHGDQLIQQTRLLLEEFGRLALDRRFKLFRIGAGDAVPRLSLAPEH